MDADSGARLVLQSSMGVKMEDVTDRSMELFECTRDCVRGSVSMNVVPIVQVSGSVIELSMGSNVDTKEPSDLTGDG
jgi:hypothetical protein